jgi:rhodanese-related sulfurtransferase
MRPWSWRRWLAGAAALAGALAPLGGSPYRRAAPGIIDVDELARVVADQEDHVSAVQLAAWIRARRPGLRVIDVRSASEFHAYHIPGAEHVPLERLATSRFADGETIVLYSEAGAHGAQAWVFLRALGHRRVFFLRGGLHEWLDDVMSPTLTADASAEAQAAFARVAELSRWFGGSPRRLAGSAAVAPGDEPARLRRGGC